ncbi:MAG: DMT family transporter [Rhodospirillaceae bacterium]|nr:MAG: DMT family transporter [Rhodospirillaceae bacterium]
MYPGAARGTRLRATLIGGIAVLLWATLALFTSSTGAVPPFLKLALTFGIAFLCAAMRWLWLVHKNGIGALGFLRQALPAWVIGICGLFGYHFFYFNALDRAPPVDASLIAYLWPLLIVLLSALLPGEKLRWEHLAGAALGLAGAALLIVQRGGGLNLSGAYLVGYLFALACAFTWSGYSLLNRRFGSASTDLVGAFCGATALLGLIAHLLFEETILPADAAQWGAIAALGLGPVGLAFFVWDYGVKHGDIKALGACSYLSPLISTGLLILFGKAEASLTVGLACLLIVGGAVLASRDLWMRRAVRA